MMQQHHPKPETHYFPPTRYVPNSPLPVLIYRSVLPGSCLAATTLPNSGDYPGGGPTAVSTRAFIEENKWIQGGVFKTFTAHHFHSVTHECYAIFRGMSRLLLGVGPLDESDEEGSERESGSGSGEGDVDGGKVRKRRGGVEVIVSRGDVIVLPAGVSHCSVEGGDSGGYEYLGLYPEGSPHWDNNFCKVEGEELDQKKENARGVPVPDYDPIYGRDGPLCQIWRKAMEKEE